MRAEIMKYIKISLFLFVLCLCLPAFSKTTTAHAGSSEPRISVKSASVVKGGSFTLKVYNTDKEQTVAFHSKDEAIASVSSTGVIKGVSCGSTDITVTVSEGDKLTNEFTCKVVVGPKPTNIKLTKSELVICSGSTKHLRVIIDPINTVGRAAFYSENKQIATVSSAGVIRAKDSGKVMITAYINYGTTDQKSVSCTVTVLDEAAYAEYLKEKNAATPTEAPESNTGDVATDSGKDTPTPAPADTPAQNDSSNNTTPGTLPAGASVA